MRKVIQLFKKMFQGNLIPSPNHPPNSPQRVPRSDHNISRQAISAQALKVLYRLHKAGFAAFLVGGSVRDLLLGLSPKDFDIATDAHPEEIQKLFRNSYIIGRRFRLVHVRFGSEIIEVATFRGHSDQAGRVQTQHGLLLRDNVYGSFEDDVWRRDFTINALYYNIADFSVIDYTGGMEDLKQKYIRIIGNPLERYREDPARMLRALRFAAKLDFTVEPDTAQPIKQHRELLLQIPPARLFDKMLKIFHSGKSLACYQLLREYGVFSLLFPGVEECLVDQQLSDFVIAAFKNTDDRINSNKNINSAFLFAVILWCPLQVEKKQYQMTQDLKEFPALNSAVIEILQTRLRHIGVPRKYTTIMREIWLFQYYLEHTRGRRVYSIFHHPRFRAAYDFLGLRSQVDPENLQPLFDWWTHFQEVDDEHREEMIKSRFAKQKRRRRKKKRHPENDESIHRTG